MENQLGWTTIEQSEKLIKAGLNLNTADMFYIFDPFVQDIAGLGIGKPEEAGDIPCWSLGSLIELMPEITMLVRDSTGIIPSHFMSIGPSESGEDIFMSEQYSTPIEAAVSTIIWLLENNYIKKEKQNELRRKI